MLTSGPQDGEPVLFLHGNLSSSTFWEETMLALPNRFRAVAPDQRCYGLSDPRGGDECYSRRRRVGRRCRRASGSFWLGPFSSGGPQFRRMRSVGHDGLISRAIEKRYADGAWAAVRFSWRSWRTRRVNSSRRRRIGSGPDASARSWKSFAKRSATRRIRIYRRAR